MWEFGAWKRSEGWIREFSNHMGLDKIIQGEM